MTDRQAPTAFVARCRAAFPDFIAWRYNTVVCRWECVSKSTAGKPVSQFFGWFRNPLTGAPIEPDPVSGLVPFRELDATAQEEVFKSMQSTGLDNRFDGAGSHKAAQRQARTYNANLTKARVTQRAETFANLIKEVDLRRPWVKYHPGAKDPRSKRMTDAHRPH